MTRLSTFGASLSGMSAGFDNVRPTDMGIYGSLLTEHLAANARNEPNLAAELRPEMASTDRVDLL